MANTLNADGFSQYSGSGSAPTYEQTKMAIKSGNTTPIFWGDPVVQATGTTGLGTGYITQAPVPVALAITGGALSAGLLTFTFTATAVAPAVGSTLVVFGGTSTAATANQAFLILTIFDHDCGCGLLWGLSRPGPRRVTPSPDCGTCVCGLLVPNQPPSTAIAVALLARYFGTPTVTLPLMW